MIGTAWGVSFYTSYDNIPQRISACTFHPLPRWGAQLSP